MSSSPPVVGAVRGRGAKSNRPGRCEPTRKAAFDDGWTPEDAEATRLVTALTAERARPIISRNDCPDVGFDQPINPYRGCKHGCVYDYIMQFAP